MTGACILRRKCRKISLSRRFSQIWQGRGFVYFSPFFHSKNRLRPIIDIMLTSICHSTPFSGISSKLSLKRRTFIAGGSQKRVVCAALCCCIEHDSTLPSVIMLLLERFMHCNGAAARCRFFCWIVKLFFFGGKFSQTNSRSPGVSFPGHSPPTPVGLSHDSYNWSIGRVKSTQAAYSHVQKWFERESKIKRSFIMTAL